MAGDRYGDEEEPWEGGDGTAQEDQLDLDAGDEALPWLESDEDYESSGIDTARLAVFAVIGLLAIGLVVGGIWWFAKERTDPALLADGSTIEAPEGPYKSRPDEPGGKTFQGTGDTSFAVAEGQTREGRVAASPAPTQSVKDDASDDTDSKVVATGVGVQVGAYSSRSTAEQGWSRLVGQYSDLQGLKHRIVEGQADIGTVYRLQALAPDVASANSLCGKLKAAGGACQVKH